MENFSDGTIALGNAIVKATKNGAFSLVGGGDSVAATYDGGTGPNQRTSRDTLRSTRRRSKKATILF